MKRTIIYSLIFIAALASNALAYDWAASGWSVKETGVVENENFMVLQNKYNQVIKVRYFDELSDDWADKIVKVYGRFQNWKYMKTGSIEFFVNGSTLEILIVPESFNYKGTDLMPYIPGGMTFLSDYELRYNFRVTKDEFFLRLSDRFVDEELLCRRMKEAIDDPVNYLKKREPEYFLSKLNELEESQKQLLDRQEKLINAVLYFQNSGFLGFGNTPIKTSVVKRVIELKTADPNLDKSKIKQILDKEKVDSSEQEIELILNIFYNEFK